MPWTPVDHEPVDRPEISRSAFGYPVVDNLNDLNTRTGTLETRTTDVATGNSALGTRTTTLETRTTDASTGNTALGARVSTVETRTTDPATGNVALGTKVNATGSTAIGNQALSDRLGTGVTTSNTATTQISALQSIQGKRGRWYSSSVAVHNTGTQAITGWNGVGTPMSDISVSGTTWTVNTTGTYLITAQYHGTMSETLNTGGNTNFFIAKTDLTSVYAQSQGYRVQYQAGAIEVSDNISSGPVDLSSGTQFSVFLGSATPVGIALSNSLQRTFCAIKRVV
jgi:hypothetical protein